MSCLLVIALLLLAGGWFLTVRGGQLQRQMGLPEGRLVYADTQQAWRPAARPLYSATYRLAGKPDYVVETEQGLIPVEVKSSFAPAVPYLGHLLQLAAYCLLIEDTTGYTPPHGLLKYADALFEVDFTPELRAELLDSLVNMRQARSTESVSRNHNQPGKCARCGFRRVCDERLI